MMPEHSTIGRNYGDFGGGELEGRGLTRLSRLWRKARPFPAPAGLLPQAELVPLCISSIVSSSRTNLSSGQCPTRMNSDCLSLSPEIVMQVVYSARLLAARLSSTIILLFVSSVNRTATRAIVIPHTVAISPWPGLVSVNDEPVGSRGTRP